MKINTIALKSSNFRYPSKEGLYSIVSTEDDSITADEAIRNNNLYWWDEHLQTNLSKLYQSTAYGK